MESDQNNFKGVIIEESLADRTVLEEVKILETKVEEVTPEHHTPHLKQWTLHTVEIPEQSVKKVAEDIRLALDTTHGHWYADFKNKTTHYIIFRDKVFVVDRTNERDYAAAKKFGISLGIPEHQVDFSPEVK